ncbi:MAG TPA: hypothetical protein VGK87_11590, partial [Anaerolineae bacterium]
MAKRITSISELVLIAVIVIALVFGVSWSSNAAEVKAISDEATPTPKPLTQATRSSALLATESVPIVATSRPTANPKATSVKKVETSIPFTGTIGPVPTSPVMSAQVAIEPGDAPLLVQAPGTMNILMLGVDSSADERFSRTDTILIASINPDMPSV